MNERMHEWTGLWFQGREAGQQKRPAKMVLEGLLGSWMKDARKISPHTLGLVPASESAGAAAAVAGTETGGVNGVGAAGGLGGGGGGGGCGGGVDEGPVFDDKDAATTTTTTTPTEAEARIDAKLGAAALMPPSAPDPALGVVGGGGGVRPRVTRPFISLNF